MKSRKIWSIPIAALALVLVLAGALAVSSVVQAHSPDDTVVIYTGTDDVVKKDDIKDVVILHSDLGAKPQSCDVGPVLPVDGKFSSTPTGTNAASWGCSIGNDALMTAGADYAFTLTIKAKLVDVVVDHIVKIQVKSGTAPVDDLTVTADSATKVVPDNTSNGAKVGSVTVTNADGTAAEGVEYTIVPDKPFGIDEEGVISVVVPLLTVDAANIKEHTITVTATIKDPITTVSTAEGEAVIVYTVAGSEPLAIDVSDMGIRSDAAVDTEVGTVTVTEDDVVLGTDGIVKTKATIIKKSEEIDFILSGATDAFAIDPKGETAEDTAIGVITTARMLTAADVGTHEMTVTAHGVAPQRTAQATFNILVTAGRAVPDPMEARHDVTFHEDDISAANLLLASTDPDANKDNKADLIENVSNHASGFEYTTGDAPDWLTLDKKGMLTVSSAGIKASTKKDGDVAANATDIATTPHVDESKQVYSHLAGGSFLYNDKLVNETNDQFADVVYEFDVNVTNGPSSSASFKVRLTVDVNEPATATGDPDTDADTETPTFKSADPYNFEILDMKDFVSTPEAGDKHKYVVTVQYVDKDGDIVGRPPFTIGPPGEGVIRVVAPGKVRPVLDKAATPDVDESWDPADDGWFVTVTVNDAFDNGTEPDATINFSVKYEEVDVGAASKSFIVDENSPKGTPVGSIASLIGGAVDYDIFSSTGEGNQDFAIAADGAVTVENPRDYDAADAVNNIALIVNALNAEDFVIGSIIVAIEIRNLNEAPTATAPSVAWVYEAAQAGDAVQVGSGADAPQAAVSATDEDGDTLTYSINSSLFNIDSDGKLSVAQNGMFDADTLATSSYDVIVTVSDGTNSVDVMLTINIRNSNENPMFVSPVLTISIAEDTAVGTVVADYDAIDPDGDTVTFVLRDSDDTTLFSINGVTGELSVKRALDYEDAAHRSLIVEVNAEDNTTGSAEIALEVTVTDVNDNPPIFAMEVDRQEVVENEPRGMVIATYVATDADASAEFNTLTYKDNSGAFHVDQSGNLMTLESLDYDSQTPCGSAGCQVTITATDGGGKSDSVVVTVRVDPSEDSVSTFKITKANPVPGVTMGEPNSALADTKVTSSVDKAPAERPGDLPATEGDGPDKFVETQWANWGTVLRIAVTSPSPDASCGNGNQCVFVLLESDNHKLKLEAYRSDTPAGATTRENLFIAAVKVVSGEGDDEEDAATDGADGAVYKHGDGSVARLEADEEDEISIRLVGSTAPPITIDVENEKPEFGNFMPEHESAFDDADVDYTFTIIDPVSGIPEPEDLPDVDGDGDYMPMVAVISDKQCKIIELDADGKRTVPKGYTEAKDLHADADLYCQGQPELRQVVDDRDFDEIDEGFDIDTKIVLRENEERFVSFIVCDAAGNCAMYTPDENNEDEALAQITIDTIKPGGEDGDKIEVRTGIKWDSTDNKYDDDRTYIQVIFEDLTPLNEDTIEVDDFVVEGHTIKSVKWYDFDANDDDADWSTRFDKGGPTDGETKDPMFRSINRSVFLELEDELAPDETPDVTVVPNGIEDSAGNEQDDGDKEADDWIAPSFTVTSIVSPRTPEGSSNVLAGDGDEVVITLTSDERIQQTRPNVSVTHVNAPASSVYTSTSREYCDNADGIGKGTRIRGEIRNSADCLDSDAASGGPLGTSIEKVSNTEWIITVNEPDATGYYSFYVSGQDRSEQNNPGSEGVAPDDLVKDFFERDGDVNSDDAHYFQGDINLSNPGVRVSGVQIEDTEPAVEFKTPLFVELDFTRGYIGDCDGITDNDEKKANCRNEKEEYAKDSFENVTVTSFVLNGVDMTDSVKTTDDKTFLVSIESINIGDHEIEIQAMDQAGNTLDEVLSIEFEVEERDPFSRRLNPGWNLVSLPGEPADSDISVVFGSNVEVRTVYTYDPIIPGGWMVAVRETLDSDWQGDLMDITARRGYWVLSDAIQDWEVSIPRLAGGAVGSGTPIQPPVIGLYAGWNLIPVVDVRGGALDDGKSISATAYLNSLDDGLDLARVLGFNTITNTWTTVLDPDDTSADAGELRIGSGYWVFVREAASLVPGGIAQ